MFEVTFPPKTLKQLPQNTTLKDEQISHLHVIMIDNAELKDGKMLNEIRNLEVNRGLKNALNRFLTNLIKE